MLTDDEREYLISAIISATDTGGMDLPSRELCEKLGIDTNHEVYPRTPEEEARLVCQRHAESAADRRKMNARAIERYGKS